MHIVLPNCALTTPPAPPPPPPPPTLPPPDADFMYPDVCVSCLYGYTFGPTGWREAMCLLVIAGFEFLTSICFGLLVSIKGELERARGGQAQEDEDEDEDDDDKLR